MIKQCPTLENLLEGDLEATITIHYATRRPDLDERRGARLSAEVYKNDRQVKIKHVFWALDKRESRTIIEVKSELIQMQIAVIKKSG